MKSIYVLSAIQYNIKQFNEESPLRTQIFIGYFSNLKKAYSNLRSNKIQSYSTIARKIKQDQVVMIPNVNLVINENSIKIKKVSIRHLRFDEIYKLDKFIDIESLLIGEMNRNNLESFVQIESSPKIRNRIKNRN